MIRDDQHPFTPEPREPEPWPERDTTPWEWANAEAPVLSMLAVTESEVVAKGDLDRIEKWERKLREKYEARGFSIGF